MKKIPVLLSFLSIVSICGSGCAMGGTRTQFGTQVCVSEKDRLPICPPIGPWKYHYSGDGSDSRDITDFNDRQKYIEANTSFAGYSNSLLGDVANVSTAFSNVYKVVYKSNWVPLQTPITKLFEDKIYVLDTFSKNISLETLNLGSYEIENGKTEKYQIGYIETKTEALSKTVSRSESMTVSESSTLGFNLGLGVSLGDIKANGEVSGSDTVSVSKTFAKTVKKTASYSTSFEHSITSEYNYTNTEGRTIVYRYGFRMVFKVYLVSIWQDNYQIHRTGSGTFGLDDNYTYTKKTNETPLGCRFFLIPVNPSLAPYCETKYYDDKGRLFIANSNPCENVYAF